MSSAIVDKYIGESARLIREMFGYARDHQPCIIFMDEIDAIGKTFYVELPTFLFKAVGFDDGKYTLLDCSKLCFILMNVTCNLCDA